MSEFFSFDLSAFIEASTGGVPIAFVVMVLVYVAKLLGARGRGLTALALGLGTVIGGFYQYSMIFAPIEAGPLLAGDLFTIAMYGLGLGGLAAGSYSLVKDELILKAVKRVVGDLFEQYSESNQVK